MKKLLAIVTVLVIASTMIPHTTATSPISLATPLSGGQEVPPVVTTGQGLFTGSLSSDQTMLAFTLRVTGLDLSKIFQSHIHVGPMGVNGPVILFLFNRATEGVFTGVKTGTLTGADLIKRPAAGVNNFADAVNMILTGNAYANVHTNEHPGGEVRGQIGVARIDIKPGSDPNSINVKSQGVVPVALISNFGFDATKVDASSLRFGRTGTEAAPVHSALQDVDGDDDTDMILHFSTQDTGFKAGDTQGILSGVYCPMFEFACVEFTSTDAVRAFFPGDVDGDLDVDIVDASLLGYAFGLRAGDELWNPYADFDGNGVIDIVDAAELGYWFGQHA